MRSILVSLAITGWVAGCASTDGVQGADARSPSDEASPPSNDPGKAFACQWIRTLARSCYDKASPEVSCDEVPRQVMIQPEGTKAPPPNVQADLDQVCIVACRAKTGGIPWEQLSTTLKCIH